MAGGGGDNGGGDDDGNGGTCTCTSAPSTPSLTSPSNGRDISSNSVTLEWRPGSSWGQSCCAARAFRLQVDDDNNASNGVIYDSLEPDFSTSETIDMSGQPTDRYWWRVRAQNEAGSSSWRSRYFDLVYSGPTADRIIGPDQLRVRYPGLSTSEYTGMYNLVATDDDRNEIENRWDPNTTASCNGQLESVDHVDIVAAANYGAGDWPDMQVYIGDPSNGSRSGSICTWTVDHDYFAGDWHVYTCDIGQAISSLDIVYWNDAWNGPSDDRDLYINYIDFHFDNSGTNYIRVQAEDDGSIDGYAVIFDPANDSNWGNRDTIFDGYDQTGSEPAIIGRERQNRRSALKFPIPISFAPSSAPATCTLSATPESADGDVGSTVTKDISICGAPPSGGLNNPSPAVDEQDVERPVTVQWDGPTNWGSACGVGSNTYTVYYRVKVNPTCEDPDPTSSVPGSGYDNYSNVPNCTDISDTGGRQSCVDTTNAFDRNTGYCWFVEANNGEFAQSSFNTTGIVWNFETEDPLDDKEWFTTIGGDLYAGGIEGQAGNPLDLPNPSDYHITWSPPYLAHEDSSGLPVSGLSSLDMNVSHSDPTPDYFPESQSGLFAENASLTSTWPENYTGEPPADAIEIDSNCDDLFIHNPPSSPALEPGEAYEADVSCVQDGIDNYGGDYRNQNPGVVALYVTGSGDLRFDSEFLTSNDNYRVVFVTGPSVNVKIDRSLTSPDPVDRASLTPAIEAAFVTVGTFEFEGTLGDPLVDPDASVVVEGPIIGRSVILGRDRGLSNNFPSEIVMYNNYYLYDLTNKERTSATGVNNYTGLFVVDVDWVSEE